MKLNIEHIRYVMKCLQENTTKIRSIKQYMLAALYNDKKLNRHIIKNAWGFVIYLVTWVPVGIAGILAKDDKGYYVPDPAPEIFEQLDLKKGPVYIKDMNDAWRAEYNVEKVDSVLLSSLSDKDLADFGVPESGDVLYFNGKPCFRYYVAVLENYFDLDHKSLSLF